MKTVQNRSLQSCSTISSITGDVVCSNNRAAATRVCKSYVYFPKAEQATFCRHGKCTAHHLGTGLCHVLQPSLSLTSLTSQGYVGHRVSSAYSLSSLSIFVQDCCCAEGACRRQCALKISFQASYTAVILWKHTHLSKNEHLAT